MLQMSYVIKVCDSSRNKKATLQFNKDDVNESAVKILLLEANRLFKINGTTIVAASDGIFIDDDDTLDCLKNEMLMILEQNEKWNVLVTAENENDRNLINQKRQHDKSPIPEIVIKRLKNKSLENLNKNVDENADKDADVNVNEQADKNAVHADENGEKYIHGSREKHTDGNIEEEENDSFNLKKPYDQFKDFKISWSKFNYNLLKQSHDRCKTKRIQKFVLNGIVDELRVVSNRIPEKVLQNVADVLVKKYPNTFADKWNDGKIQGPGTARAIAKMRNRNNYLNRPHMDSNNLSNALKIPLKK